MNFVYLLLGGNLGNRFEILDNAITEIEIHIGKILKKSSIYETKAWGKEDQPDFLNQVVLVQTQIDVFTVLNKILEIEKKLGRIRFEKWGERLIDIDILFFNDQIINTDNLKIPHPQLHKRMFTLVPLNEVSNGFVHPVLNEKISTLLKNCKDDLLVEAVEYTFSG